MRAKSQLSESRSAPMENQVGEMENTPVVLVVEPIAEIGLSRMQEAGCELLRCDGLAAAREQGWLDKAEALIIRSASMVDATLLAEMPRLRAVGRAGVGLDNVDLDAATERGIAVMNTPGGNAVAAGELAFAHMLALSRHLVQADSTMRGGGWERHRFVGRELAAKTLGLVGLGRVGGVVAKRALAFEMQVKVFDPYLSSERAQTLGLQPCSLDEVLRDSDIVSLHAPLTGETSDLINAQTLSTMKSDALLVNCARGGLIDEQALADALAEGRLGGAAVDVYRSEPPTDSPLLGAPRLIHTPHLGASTREAKENVGRALAEGLIGLFFRDDYSAAVNLPSAGAGIGNDAKQQREWLELARRIGRFQGGLLSEAPAKLEVEVSGTEEVDPSPVAQAVLTGLLQVIGGETVNAINAARKADALGLRVAVTRVAPQEGYPHRIHTRVSVNRNTETIAREVDGALLAPGAPRIIAVDGRWIDFEPSGDALVMWNQDVPGVLGQVGAALGTVGVNIAELRLGRSDDLPGAISVWQVDQPVHAELLDRLRQMPEIDEVLQVRLGARAASR